jgi:hypothetical protein
MKEEALGKPFSIDQGSGKGAGRRIPGPAARMVKKPQRTRRITKGKNRAKAPAFHGCALLDFCGLLGFQAVRELARSAVLSRQIRSFLQLLGLSVLKRPT